MASNQTPTIGLPQWAGSDAFRMAEFNQAFSAIDAAIAGRALVATGQYTGTGTYGRDNPTWLSFGFRPLLVAVTLNGTSFAFAAANIILTGQTTSYGLMSSSQPGFNSAYYPHWTIQWGDHTVSWYDDNNAEKQLNVSGARYAWLALGVAT